jgi:hypothetical protein
MPTTLGSRRVTSPCTKVTHAPLSSARFRAFASAL